MTDIASYRTKVLAMLDDPSLERYTANQVDEALRSALALYSNLKPQVLLMTDCATSGNRRFTVANDASALEAKAITRLEWPQSEPSSRDDVSYYAYLNAGVWTIETKNVVIPLNEDIIVEYTLWHTISGLDSATATTIPTADLSIFIMAAASFAARSRAMSKIESNNLNPSEAKDTLLAAQTWFEIFMAAFTDSNKSFHSSNWADQTKIATDY